MHFVNETAIQIALPFRFVCFRPACRCVPLPDRGTGRRTAGLAETDSIRRFRLPDASHGNAHEQRKTNLETVFRPAAFPSIRIDPGDRDEDLTPREGLKRVQNAHFRILEYSQMTIDKTELFWYC